MEWGNAGAEDENEESVELSRKCDLTEWNRAANCLCDILRVINQTDSRPDIDWISWNNIDSPFDAILLKSAAPSTMTIRIIHPPQSANGCH